MMLLDNIRIVGLVCNRPAWLLGGVAQSDFGGSVCVCVCGEGGGEGDVSEGSNYEVEVVMVYHR